MQGLGFHQRPRRLGAQGARMERQWPQFQFEQLRGSMVAEDRDTRLPETVSGRGLFGTEGAQKPYVVLLDPPLRPREGKTFEEIPHLYFIQRTPLFGSCACSILKDESGRTNCSSPRRLSVGGRMADVLRAMARRWRMARRRSWTRKRRRSEGRVRSSRADQLPKDPPPPVTLAGDKPFRILSLDGGGIRGIYADIACRHRSQDYRRAPIAGYFDTIAGTSTGGIIAHWARPEENGGGNTRRSTSIKAVGSSRSTGRGIENSGSSAS